MKISKFIPAIAVMSLAGIAPLGMAAENTHEGMIYTGKVTTVSPTADTITVLRNGQTETFRIDRNTRLSTLSKPDATLKDLEFGDKVTVRYQDEPMGVTATTVRESAAK